MRRAWLSLLPVAALLGGCGVADTAASTTVPATAAVYADAATAQAASIDTGLAFIPNQGQKAGDALFSAHAFGGVVQFAPMGYQFALPTDRQDPSGRPAATQVVSRWFVAADAGVALAAYGQPTSEISVDAPAGQARLPVYASIAYQRLYPGVSIVYGGDTSSMSSTIFINPGADPAQICWAYPEAESVAVDPATGDLLIRLPPSAAAEIRERRPLAWQEGASSAGDVAVAYAVAADGTIGMSLGAYDHAERLFISQSLQMGDPSAAGAATPAPRAAQVPAGGCGGPRPTADILTPTAVPTYDWQLAEMGLDAGPTPTLRPADATARAERNSNRTAVAQNQATTRAITPRAIDNASSRRRVYTPLPTIPSPDGIVQCELVQTDIHVLMGSCFRKTQGERRITIGAGIQVTLSDDRHDDLGIIIIYETDKPYKVYRLPENEGNLTIIAATWPHITVRSVIGKEHGFNAETLEWETPQATPAPTGTPTPERASPSIR